MEKIAFDEKELTPLFEMPGMFGGPSVPIFNSPISNGENYYNTLAKRESMFVPTFLDQQIFMPRCVPDNIARANVFDGGEFVEPYTNGYPDMFGVEWVYVPIATGSMPREGSKLMDDVNTWQESISFPDIESFDWEGQSTLSESYLDTKMPIMVTIFTGYYERLISFMEFEGAALAMIDEDQTDAVHELFDALTDLYCRMVDKYVEYFHISGIQLHDDWGSQRAPFFSLATIQTMLVPHIKKLTDHVHSKGLFFEFHCCGNNEMVAQAIVETGADTWTPQAMNNVSEIYRKFGKEIVLGVSLPSLAEQSSDEEIAKAAQEFVDEFVHPDAPVILGFYSELHRGLVEEVYRLSRIKLSV